MPINTLQVRLTVDLDMQLTCSSLAAGALTSEPWYLVVARPTFSLKQPPTMADLHAFRVRNNEPYFCSFRVLPYRLAVKTTGLFVRCLCIHSDQAWLRRFPMARS